MTLKTRPPLASEAGPGRFKSRLAALWTLLKRQKSSQYYICDRIYFINIQL